MFLLLITSECINWFANFQLLLKITVEILDQQLKFIPLNPEFIFTHLRHICLEGLIIIY